MAEWISEQIEHLRPGQLLLGRYIVRDLLGSGELGIVYRCTTLSNPNDLRALKIVRPDVRKQPELLARFRNELAVSKKVRHENVIRYYEFLKSDTFEALSMECVEGGTLEDLLVSGEHLELDEIIRILIQLCDGLIAIHRAGFLHRDVKPRNLLLTKNREIKIGDFNTAVTHAHRKRRSETGMIGTLEYMSPEILIDGTADVRSDMYSWGVIAYQLICGILPFPYDSEDEHIRRKLRGAFQSPKVRRPDCPDHLCKTIERALHYRSKARFKNMKELRSALTKSPDACRTGGPLAFLRKFVPKMR